MTSLFLRAVASLRSAAAALLGGPRDPNSRSHVSKCADSRILLCKFQIPTFRVSKAPLPEVRGGTQIPDPMFPSVQIPGYSSANSRFRVSEFPAPQPHVGPSRREHPKFQIPSFRVCSFLGPFTGPRRRGPKFQIPSFRVSGDPSRVRAGGRHQIPDSEFPSFRGPSQLPRAHLTYTLHV